MATPFNPFGAMPRAQGPSSNQDDPLTPGARTMVNNYIRSQAQAQRAAASYDPLDDEIKTINERRANVRYQQEGVKNTLNRFLETEGADLFEKDPLTGKTMKNPDGTFVPKLGLEVESLKKRTQDKTGLIAGALSPTRQAGDPTPEAREAERRLAEIEPVFRLKQEKFDRIQNEMKRLQDADMAFENRLAELGRAREARYTVTPQDVAQAVTEVNMGRAATGAKPVTERDLAGPTGKQKPAAAPAYAPGTQAAVVDPTTGQPVGRAIAPEAVAQKVRQEAAQKNLDPVGAELVELASLRDQGVTVVGGRLINDVIAERGGDQAVANVRVLETVKKLNSRLLEIENDLPNAGDKMRGKLEREKAVITKLRDQKQGLIDAIPTGERLKNALGAIAAGVADIPAGVADWAAVAASKLDQVVPEFMQSGDGKNVDNYALAKFAKVIRDTVGEIAPQDPRLAEEFWSNKVPNGIGSMFGFFGPSAALKSRYVVPLVLGGAVGGAEGYKDAVQNGADEETAFLSYLLNTGVGFSEIVPVGRMIDRLDKASGGKAKRVLIDAGVEGFEEFAQEFFQTSAGNTIAKALYDQNREIFEGSGEAGAVGGVTGVLTSLVVSALPGKQRGAAPGATAQPPAPTTPPAGQPVPPTQPQPEGGGSNGRQEEGQGSQVLNPPPTPPAAGNQQPPPAATPSPAPAPAPEKDVTLDDQAPKSFAITNADGETTVVEATRESQAIAKLPSDFGPIKSITRAERPVDKVEGEKLDREWSAFAPESKTLGIPRAEMPQVKAEHRGALTQFLKGRDITSEETEVRPSELKPTQAEFSPAKVQKAREFKGGDRAILVSQDNYVIDGHHQWMAKLTDAPDQFMRVIRVDAPIRDVLDTMKEFPSAQASEGATSTPEPQPNQSGQGGTTTPPPGANIGSAPAPVSPDDLQRNMVERVRREIPDIEVRENSEGKVGVTTVGGKPVLFVDKAKLSQVHEQRGRSDAALQAANEEEAIHARQVKDGRGDPFSAANRAAWNNLPTEVREAVSETHHSAGASFGSDGHAFLEFDRMRTQLRESGHITEWHNPQKRAAAERAERAIRAYESKQSGAAPFSPPPVAPSDKPRKSPTPTPAPVPAAAKPPTIARGTNKPQTFVSAVSKASGLKGKDKAVKFLTDFAPRMHKANAKAFEEMEVHVLSADEWKANTATSTRTPDSAAAYNPETNTLYFQADKMRDPETAVSAVVHEMGHFAEKFALGEEFTQREWEKLTDNQRLDAYEAYSGRGTFSVKGGATAAFGTLKNDKRARAEWVAMQFARVVRGETDGMSKTMVEKLKALLQMARDLVTKWVGARGLTTKQLDGRILEMLGYAEKTEQHRLVGKNSEGVNVYEDARGARHIERVRDILVSEPIELVPTRGAGGGVEYRPGVRSAAVRAGTEFETVEERDARTRPATAPAGTRESAVPVAQTKFQLAREKIGPNATVASIIRDVVLAREDVQNALKNTPQNAGPMIQLAAREELGALAMDVVRWEGRNALGKSWAQDYDVYSGIGNDAIVSGILSEARKRGLTATTPAAAVQPAEPTPGLNISGAGNPAPAAAAPASPAPKPSISAELKALGDELFGTPAVSTFTQKLDPAKLEVANKFVGLLVREKPDIRSRAALARFITENFPKARPYSDSVFRMMGGFVDLDETGTWADTYAQIDNPAPAAETTPSNEPRPEQQPATDGQRDPVDRDGGAQERGAGGNPDQGAGDGANRPVLAGASANDVQAPALGQPGRADQSGEPPVGQSSPGGEDRGRDQPVSDVSGGDGSEVAGNVPDGAGEGTSAGKRRRGSVTRPDVELEPTAPGRSNYRITDPEAIVGGGPKARFEKNRKSIETFQDLTASNREPSAAELDTLAGYTGWGSFGQELFQGSWERPMPKEGWETQDRWLRDHLGREDWESAQRSIINAHYTDPITVETMWGMVRRMGFTGGRVLEPSAGIGNFFGLMPADLAEKSQLTGIELDRLTGGMARLLYPNANLQIKGYQDSKTSDNFYDLVIGNWPFANVSPADRRYDKFGASLHDYFFLKALDQVRPGGLVIGITSNSTMDKKSVQVRSALARKAELVGAYRLPAGAFEKYAGTKVVTDIIVLKKRVEPVSSEEADKAGWLNTQEIDTPSGQKIEVNEYWEKNPSHVLGRLNWGHGTTTGRPGMIVERPNGYEAKLRDLASKVPANVMAPWSGGEHTIRYVGNQTTARQNSIVEKGGKFYQVRGEHLALLEDVVKWKVKDPKKTEQRATEMKGLIELRDGLVRLLYDQSVTNDDLSKTREALKKKYDAFVKAHGPLAESKMLDVMQRAGDITARLLANVEELNASGKWVPRSILTTDIVRRAPRMDNVTIEDAYSIDRYQNISIDPKRIAELAKVSEEQVIEKLAATGQIFKTPAGPWQARDQYLSGNVRQKLREAEDAAQQGMDMARNIEALKAIQPKDVPYLSIEPQLGATWIRNDYYKQFIKSLLGLTDGDMENVNVELRPRGYKVEIKRDYIVRKPEATTQWGTKEISWKKIIDAAMNNGLVKIIKHDPETGPYTDEKATKEANAKVAAIREEFKAWLWKEPARAIDLQNTYNETFNAVVTPDFDGSHLRLTGLALNLGSGPFDFRTHQKNAVWRGIVNGRLVGAHEVGTGKTFTMAGLALEARRLGMFRKPMLFAHNANSASVAADIQLAYPGAKVLYVNNLAPEVRDSAMQQIALDDWDVVVLPHSLIDRVTLREETMMAQARELIRELEQEAIDAAADDNVTITVEDMDSGDYKKKLARTGATAKELVKQRERIIERIKKQAQKTRDDSVFFEDMGVDAVIVDEAHIFKKIPIATRQRLKGLNKAGSDRSVLLTMLTDYVKSKNGGKGVFLFTGTPITNTVNEAYNMMRYAMDDTMERDGIKRWDAWFNAFAESSTDVELTAGGTWEPVERLTQFVNVPELARLAAQSFDVVYAKDMPEFKPRPTKEGRDETGSGRPFKQKIDVTVPMTPNQVAHLGDLRERVRQWNAMKGKERIQEMRSGGRRSPIIIEGEGVKAALDYRLMDPSAPDEKDSKVNRMLETAMNHYREHPKATQMIFMERGYYDSVTRTRKNKDGTKTTYKVPAFNLANDIVEKLVAQGIPREQIAVFPWLSKEKRKLAAEAMQRGEIRFAIGGTETMGTGVNAQNELRAMHHLDAPWMPGELEQRNGRGWRQGNRWNSVIEYRYFTEGSHDGRRWQILLTKDKFIRRFVEAVSKKGETGLRIIDGDGADLSEGSSEEAGEAEDSDFSESFSSAVGDPRILQRAKLQRRIEDVKRRKAMHIGAQRDAAREIDRQRGEIQTKENQVTQFEADIAQYAARPAEFSVTIDGKTYTDRKKADAALEAIPVAPMKPWEKKEVGQIAGFTLVVQRGFSPMDSKWEVVGRTRHSFGGTIASVEGVLRGMSRTPERLRSEIASANASIRNLESLLNTPFPREAQLKGLEKQLAQIERELSQSPAAPPSWLRNGAPVGSLVMFEGKSYDVAAHRWDATNWWLLVHDPEQQDAELIPIPYDQAKDADGNQLFDSREFQVPSLGGGTAAPEGAQGTDGQPVAPPAATPSASSIRTPAGFGVGDVVRLRRMEGLWSITRIVPPESGTDNDASWDVEVTDRFDPNQSEIVRGDELDRPGPNEVTQPQELAKPIARDPQLPIGDAPMDAPRRARLQRLLDDVQRKIDEDPDATGSNSSKVRMTNLAALEERLTKELAKEDAAALSRAKANRDLLGTPPENRVDPTEPAALKFADAVPGDYSESDLRLIREFESAENARRGSNVVRLTPKRLVTGAGDADPGRGLSPELYGDRGVAAGVDRFRSGLQSIFGKRILFVSPSQPVTWGAMTAPNRANTILVNADTTAPIAALLGHEFGHNIQAQNPAVWATMRDIIAQQAGEIPQAYRDRKASENYTTREAQLNEWVSDFLGTRFNEPEFWGKVAQQAEAQGATSALREFAKAANAWFNKLIDRVNKVLTRFADKKFVRDIEALRDGLAAALVRYQKEGPYYNDPAADPKNFTGDLLDSKEEQADDGETLGTPPVTGTPAQEAILAKVNGTLEDKRTLVEKFRDYLADLRDYVALELKQKMLDQFASIKRLERSVFGTAALDASVSAYKSARLTKNLPSVMDYLMNHGTIAYRNGSFSMGGGRGLLQIFKPLIDAGTLRLWEGYATAVRADRLLAEGKETNFGRTWDPATGQWVWDAATARSEIDALLALRQQYPEFETVRQDYVAFQKSILDVAEAAGLVNADQRAMWEKSDYVPFYRITESLDAKGPRKRRGIADQRSGVRKLKGGAAPVAIMENIVRNIETMVDASFKNIAMQRVADLAQGNNDMLVQIPYKAVPFKASVDEVLQKLEEAGVDTSGLSTDEAAEFVRFWRMRAPQGKDVVSVMVDGRPIYYRVKDAALLRSVQSMGPRSYSWWMKALMAPKTALTNLVTLDPAFMAANTIRDSFSAWVIADTPIKPGIDSAIGFVKSLRNDPSKLAVMAAGGGSGHYTNLREGRIRDYIRQLTPADRKAFLESIVDTPKKFARLYADLGRATENANRLAIFDSAKKRGASDAEAAFQALDIMDFGLRGDSAALNFFLDTVPFLNARIQGLYRLGRGLKENPRRVATHGAIIMAATMVGLAANWDDDRYWELPEWERDIYYHFWLGDQHVRIPKPFEVGQIFSTIPERIMEFVGKTGDGKLLGRRMLTMLADTFAMNPIPQALKPVAERAMNLNTFTGRPIISRGDEFKQPEQQFNVFTSETIREMAEAMPDSAPEWMRSPKTLEHFVRGYFGSLGMYALTGADALTRAATDAPEEPAMQPGDLWVMKRFAPSSDMRETKYVAQFYELHRETTALVRQIKELQKTNPAEARAVQAENMDLVRFAPRADSTYDVLQSIRKQEQRIYASNDDPETKRQRLAALAQRRNELTRAAMLSGPQRPRPLFNPFSQN